MNGFFELTICWTIFHICVHICVCSHFLSRVVFVQLMKNKMNVRLHVPAVKMSQIMNTTVFALVCVRVCNILKFVSHRVIESDVYRWNELAEKKEMLSSFCSHRTVQLDWHSKWEKSAIQSACAVHQNTHRMKCVEIKCGNVAKRNKAKRNEAKQKRQPVSCIHYKQ